MYSIVLMAALSTGAAEPGCHWKCGCAGACYGCGGCYGACYGGCGGCGGCGGYGYYNPCFNSCACYGASAYSCYGYCAGYCYGGYCMGGFTSYAPAIIAPPPAGKQPEVVPPPKPKQPKESDTSLNEQARLIIEVPADAQLFIDGQPMKTTADRRVFRTPKLDRKLTYYYDVKAEVVRDGKTVTSTKRVILRAGEEVRAVFADLPATRGEATANAAR